ncbi:MAG: hypothetical protein IJO71_00750 [Microbacterium sp.]|jgi:hypothetical protein|uniref:hypothetical protein n=1 Tax=Microbacterium sp. TaxID=51671 RepID=UPI0025E935D6|nr:hypothetical protein [Microbacterium sp.]MBQ9915714.1 hypothetical protein [Microbacterium sp.]
MAASAEVEQEILRDLISKWVSLGLEYISGTEGVRAIYVYAASEVPGVTYVGIAFDKDGEIQYPTRARGGGEEAIRLSGRMIDILFEDLDEAQRRFDEAGVPQPTEYRVYYEIATRELDVQLSREIIYRGSEYTPDFDGFRLWLGDRAPKL